MKNTFYFILKLFYVPKDTQVFVPTFLVIFQNNDVSAGEQIEIIIKHAIKKKAIRVKAIRK